MTTLLLRLYGWLLHLYPREYRDEFGEEMQITFADAVAEASKYGCFALVHIDLREILDLIPAIV